MGTGLSRSFLQYFCGYLTFIYSDYVWNITIVRPSILSSLLQTCETLKNTACSCCYMYLHLLIQDNGLDPSIYSPPSIGPIAILGMSRGQTVGFLYHISFPFYSTYIVSRLACE